MQKPSPRRDGRPFSNGRTCGRGGSPARTLGEFNTANSKVKREDTIFDLMQQAADFSKSIPATVEILKREAEANGGVKFGSLETQMKAKIMNKLDLL
jgi:hypothetical protein